MLGQRSGYARLAAFVAILFGIVACAGDESRWVSQPGVGVEQQASAVPSAVPSWSPSPSLSVSPSPTASPTPAAPSSATPAAPTVTSQAPEGGFNVRPPGDGRGPADTIIRTAGADVALTFDDGPDPINTPAILQVLRENGVKATFCMVGFRVRDRPDLVRQIYADGHTLCNHSWQHLTDLAKRDPAYIDWDLRHTNDMIHAAVGADAPIKYFRAPGGNFTPSLVAKASELGMASIYWDVDPRDWDHKPDNGHQAHINRVIAQVKSQIRQGSIVLSHDNGQPDTIVAYRQLIPWMKRYFALEGLPT
ncbi:polysaccharide deacetylase family protein [Dactylosporangium sp. NPDC000555]|uniref:polysaccharide deacetylase family protein n=1 Tax=Dactylosporangium sp. NPDC000555 TaxID=3154260 RepID=UPI003319242B